MYVAIAVPSSQMRVYDKGQNVTQAYMPSSSLFDNVVHFISSLFHFLFEHATFIRIFFSKNTHKMQINGNIVYNYNYNQIICTSLSLHTDVKTNEDKN